MAQFNKLFSLILFVFLTFIPGVVNACYQLDSSVSIPEGFGAAYNVLSAEQETLITVDCSQPEAYVEVGNGSVYQYIYEKGYFYRDGSWQEFTFSNADPDPENVWIKEKANISISLTEEELLATNYIVAYICTWNGEKWQCGCRESNCASRYWQLQSFSYSNESAGGGCEDNDSDGYDSCAVGQVGDDGKELDCDDSSNWVNPGSFEVCDTVDNNCNGEVDEDCDDDGDGYCDSTMKLYGGNSMCPNNVFNGDGTQGRDCNDNDSLINPSANEECDGVDNNCDKNTDEGCVCVDRDNDGYDTCNPGDLGDDGLVEDCNDNAWDRSPGAIELCDNVDNDCDDEIDEGGVCCVDNDGDGFDTCSLGVDGDDGKEIDCNDNQWFRNPDAPETCDNYDNNCNGTIDEGCDDDGDGYCNSEIRFYNYPVNVCPKSNLSNDSFGDDCNDSDYYINPEEAEECDGEDNDCDGEVDEGCACQAGETQSCGSDIGACQKGSKTCVSGVWGECQGEIKAVSEVCNDSLDNDCDGEVDEGCSSCQDNDNDGYDNCVLNSQGDDGKVVDCNDTISWVNPGAKENCDTVDNDCDGVVDEDCDSDGDEYCTTAVQMYNSNSMCPNTPYEEGRYGDDCDDKSAAVNPGVQENCSNQVDDNCNGEINEGCTCVEDWTCTSWSDCNNNKQTRICTDNNNCGTNVNKPSESQSCSASCNDNDRDGYGDPASVDCIYPDFDCDDNIYDIKPGAFDFCDNGIDEDCDGADDNCSELNVDILNPLNNTDFNIDSSLNFRGGVIGGRAPYIFRWSSDQDGYLGEGEWFTYDISVTASLGEHIITLEVEDYNGDKSTDTIKVNINSANTLTANLNFSRYEFVNGNQLSWGVDINGGVEPYSINWTSDLMGIISNRQWVSVDTSVTPWTIGEHLIQAEIQDANGEVITLSTIIKITDVSLNMWPENASNFYFGDIIWFNANILGGTGPYNYRWTSDQDGLLRDSVSKPYSYDSFDISSLSEGIHNIELEVTYDTNKTISKNIQIQINPIDPTQVECFDFTDCNDGDPCTDDFCNNPGLMSSSCSYDFKTVCQDDDNCCPGGCDMTNDNNCSVSSDNDDPAKVLVVYNDQCARDNNENGINDDKELALYYQQKRNIPDENMLPVYPNVGSGGCAYYYYQVESYPTFYNDIVVTIQDKLSQLGENNIYYLNLIGLPTQIYTDQGTRSLDQALVTLNDIEQAADYYSYWDSCNFTEYCEQFYGSTLTKSRFNHSYKYNGDNMYLVTRIHKNNLIDAALYGEKYIYNEAGYYRGKGYVDTRYSEYTDNYLNDNYPIFSDADSYARGDRKMAYGKRIFDKEGWDYKWEASGKEIGESGAIFTDGSNAEFVNDAMWYEGWYNYARYLDVWNWKAGSIACDLNSNSGVKFLQDAFDRGLTAGVGVTGEPYLTGHPAPEVFIHYMLNGYNFAESSVLSYPGWKWKGIAYGDPLYNPNKADKIKTKDEVAPNIIQVFHEANIEDTASSTYVTVRLDMNGANPDVATFKLEYGMDTNYGKVIDYDEVYTMEKEFMLGNLSADTTYHYRIIAKDPVGNITTSEDNTFKTSSDSSVLPGDITANASVNIGNAPLSVNFNSSFSDTPTTLEWNFADGDMASEQNPTHTFTKGFYRVVLNAEFTNGLSDSQELLIIAK